MTKNRCFNKQSENKEFKKKKKKKLKTCTENN